MTNRPNTEIAGRARRAGDLYELDGAIIHRIVAYRNAAKAVRDAPVSVSALARQGRATELPGIGATIQEKVLALADDGAIPAAVKLRAKSPPGLMEMTRLPGLGPKRARRLFDELEIDSLEALRDGRRGAPDPDAARALAPRPRRRIARRRSTRTPAERPRGARRARPRARRRRAAGRGAARAHPAAERVELAGSARRMTDSVKDLDVIATATDPRRSRAPRRARPVEAAGTPGRGAARGCGRTPA